MDANATTLKAIIDEMIGETQKDYSINLPVSIGERVEQVVKNECALAEARVLERLKKKLGLE